jgi:hypothetical protein
VNVVDNYHILITEAQYLGLSLFKRQFNNDPAVEMQFLEWFKHGHSINMSKKSFLSLAGLTYFGNMSGNTMDIQSHIKSAVSMAEGDDDVEVEIKPKKKPKRNARTIDKTAETELEPKKKPKRNARTIDKTAETELEPKKKPKMNARTLDKTAETEMEPKTKPKRDARTLEETVEIILHSTDLKKQKIDVVDVIPPNSKKIPEDKLKNRLMVTGDDGSSHMPALYTWLMGTYAGHAFYKTGARELYNAINGGITFGIFTVNDARDFFLAPWEYHPDSYAQILEVLNKVKPLNDKVTAALGSLDEKNVLKGLNVNDLYKAIINGHVNDIPVTREMTQAIANLLKGAGAMDIFRMLKGRGDWSNKSMNKLHPDRVINMVKTYLHFDPSNLLTTISTMITNSFSTKYLMTLFRDFAPKLLQDGLKGVLENEWVNARMSLGDLKSESFREKTIGAVSGVVISSCAAIIAGVRTAANIRDIAYESNKYRKGENSNVKRALVKALLDGDNLYNLAHTLVVSSMEISAVTASVGSSVAMSSFNGSGSLNAYLGSLAIKETVNSVARLTVGLEQTATITAGLNVKKGIGMVLSTAIATAKFTHNTLADQLTGKSKVSIMREMFKLSGSKRSRDTEIEDATREHKKRLIDKDVVSATHIREKYWYNNVFRRNAITDMMIHI